MDEPPRGIREVDPDASSSPDRVPCQFDLREQWIAAQWAVKTSYVFQRLGQQLLAPSTHPFLLRLNGKPPPQVTVLVGSHYRALKAPTNSAYVQKPLTLVLGD